MPDPNNVYLNREKLLFMLIPKAGNTSIKQAIFKARGINWGDDINHFCWHLNQCPKDGVGFADKTLAKWYYGIAFVRHPVGRLVSFYRDKVVTGTYGNVSRRAGISNKMTFAEFVAHLATIDDRDADQHWRSMVKDLCTFEGELLPKFVGKVELLHLHWSTVRRFCRGRGLVLPQLLRENQSKKVPVIIDEDSLELIWQRYQKDFEVFQYADPRVHKEHAAS